MSAGVETPEGLASVLSRLRTKEQVEGVLAVGSLVSNTLTPASDYDLVIVLKGVERAWYVGVTAIDDRFTDLLFVSANALRQIRALASPLATGHELAPVIHWFERGAILFDAGGQLAAAQRHVRQRALVQPIADDAAYGAWFAVNYNLAVADRLCRSTDARYQAMADIRMAVYGHSDLWFNYFTIRCIPWHGDKAAVQYLARHDPDYLTLYRRLIETTDRPARLACYRRAAARVTAPLGGLWSWPPDVTNIQSPPQTWADLLDG